MTNDNNRTDINSLLGRTITHITRDKYTGDIFIHSGPDRIITIADDALWYDGAGNHFLGEYDLPEEKR